MSSILGAGNERSSATDERHLGRVSNDTVSLSTLATGGVVDDIRNVFVAGEGLSSHGRLINGEKSVSGTVFLSVLIILVDILGGIARITTLGFELIQVGLVSSRVVIGADNTSIGGDDLTILDNDLGCVR
jgi:hypothetical protein